MKEQNIEKLFKDTFSNFEADVNPSVWANIEQGLPQNIPGSSPAAKPSGFFGKIALNTIVLVAAISAALIGTTIYISSQKPAAKDALVQDIKAQPISVNTNPAVISDATPAPGNNSNNAIAKSNSEAPQKQAASKAEQKIQLS